MKKPLKRYDATFKRDAVELRLTSGKPLKALAVELGVCDVTLRNWRDRHLAKTQPIETEDLLHKGGWRRLAGRKVEPGTLGME